MGVLGYRERDPIEKKKAILPPWKLELQPKRLEIGERESPRLQIAASGCPSDFASIYNRNAKLLMPMPFAGADRVRRDGRGRAGRRSHRCGDC